MFLSPSSVLNVFWLTCVHSRVYHGKDTGEKGRNYKSVNCATAFLLGVH